MSLFLAQHFFRASSAVARRTIMYDVVPEINLPLLSYGVHSYLVLWFFNQLAVKEVH